ncbi:alpha-ribazole phosphatase [Calderihabitans maritimus]|uniref:Alpha-ribazole phosphatase n=1 Tax=Calderihabitans maritimus TaxID=1246530 RepID=A0A1Z5HPQ3_9FIRM|nr:alpha-ribazole phosphatase [Calderihabitans maritimus]GAW91512.1 phosphoglycerate mutase GpmB [Calderihabitans maritimus]
MTKLVLVRHGHTPWNKGRRYQGHSDVQLSEEGREQARRLRDRFKETKIDAIYASDLSRALETAQIIAEPHGLIVQQIPELREMNFGVWEGLTFAEIQAQFRELADGWYKNPADLQIPQGETFRQVRDRAYKAVLELVAKHPDETVLVVSHGGTIRAVICAVLDLEMDRIWQFRQDNTAVNIIEFYEGRTVISLLNDTHHLYDSGVS